MLKRVFYIQKILTFVFYFPDIVIFVVSQYVSVRQLRNQRNQGSHRKSENSKPDQQKTEKMELNQENSGKISGNYFTGP